MTANDPVLTSKDSRLILVLQSIIQELSILKEQLEILDEIIHHHAPEKGMTQDNE